MKIITLNTWGNSGPYQERWNFLLEELKTYHPDILFLQEVFEPTLAKKIKESFSYPYLLSSYEAGLAIISRSPIFKNQTLKYKAISPSEQQDRQALLVEFKLKGEKILAVNTHLSWRIEDKLIRLEQVQELLQTIANKGYRALLAGDFNDVRGSSPIDEIEKADYIDLCNLVHPKKKLFTWNNQNPFIQTHSVKFPDRQIDFLFLHRKLMTSNRVKSCEIIFNRPNQNGIYPSDHYGILTEIEF